MPQVYPSSGEISSIIQLIKTYSAQNSSIGTAPNHCNFSVQWAAGVLFVIQKISGFFSICNMKKFFEVPDKNFGAPGIYHFNMKENTEIKFSTR